MTYRDNLEKVRQAFDDIMVEWPAYTDLQLAQSMPCWFVFMDGLDFSEPRKVSKLLVRVIGVGGYVDAADSQNICADMAYQAEPVVKTLGFNVEGTGVDTMDWDDQKVWYFSLSFTYSYD